MDKTVSVIVPMFNAQATIRECIESLLRLDPLPYEIIIVDNGSTDDSVAIVEKVVKEKEMSLVAILSEKERGPAAARNCGAKAAKGGILAFTDSDCTVPQDWVKIVIDEFSDPNSPDMVAGGTIAMEKRSALNKFTYALRVKSERSDNKIRYFDKNYFFYGPIFATMNLSVKKESYDRLSGFDGTFINAEDADFCTRALNNNMIVKFRPDLVVYHRERDTVTGLFKQFYFYEYWAARFFKAHYKGLWVVRIPRIKAFVINAGFSAVFIGKASVLVALILPVLYGFFVGKALVSASIILLYLLLTCIHANKLITSTGLKLDGLFDLFRVVFYIVVKQAAEVLGKCVGSVKYSIIYI